MEPFIKGFLPLLCSFSACVSCWTKPLNHSQNLTLQSWSHVLIEGRWCRALGIFLVLPVLNLRSSHLPLSGYIPGWSYSSWWAAAPSWPITKLQGTRTDSPHSTVEGSYQWAQLHMPSIEWALLRFSSAPPGSWTQKLLLYQTFVASLIASAPLQLRDTWMLF